MRGFTITDLTVNRALAPLGLTKRTQRLHRLSASQGIHRLVTLVSNARFPPRTTRRHNGPLDFGLATSPGFITIPNSVG
jgi:hypothetical protein